MPFAREIGDRLVAWFSTSARDLPWRRTRDPYRIWVAEVLLQQTRVEQARPYYERFLREFPTVQALARAPIDRVLKFWEGAGYYGRAHRLHAAAKEVVEEHGGHLPKDAPTLRMLPGFGPYTSRSVAAMASGAREVALDANALRVLARLFLLRPADRSLADRAERAGLEALADHPPRAFNESLMELGQRYCSARAPRCASCPLSDLCRARRELADPGSFPPPRPRPPRPRVVAAVGVLFRSGRVLVARRPAGGLLAGLWEFPGGKLEKRESARAAVVREFLEETRLPVRVVRSLGSVQHDYSHFHATLHVFLLSTASTRPALSPEARELRWVLPGELRALALPGATRKMLDRLPSSGPEERGAKARRARTVSPRASRGSGSHQGRARA